MAMPDIETSRDDYEIISFGLEPGDCLVFQAMVAHGAPGNPSILHRRRAYSTRWIGDDARYFERPGEVAIPTFETGLTDGDEYIVDMFPTVWLLDK